MKDLHDNKTLELELELVGVQVPAKKRGRPAKYANGAARQKAYRERKKAEGMREVKAWTKDVRDEKPLLYSTIIDLSEVRANRFCL